MTDLPADWAIEKAHKLLGWGVGWATVKTGSPKVYGDCIEFARYIEAHEKPPVDRKLLVAREAAARYYEAQGVGYESAVNLCREGLNDEALPVVLEAITLWEDGFGKDPEATAPQCQ